MLKTNCNTFKMLGRRMPTRKKWVALLIHSALTITKGKVYAQMFSLSDWDRAASGLITCCN